MEIHGHVQGLWRDHKGLEPRSRWEWEGLSKVYSGSVVGDVPRLDQFPDAEQWACKIRDVVEPDASLGSEQQQEA